MDFEGNKQIFWWGLMGNLVYLDTFLTACHSTATVETYITRRNINFNNDTEAMLIWPGELLSTSNNFYIMRYQVSLKESSEAGLTGMINDIITNINKFNKRLAIGGYTKEATLVHIEFAYSKRGFINKVGKYYRDIFLDVTWSTA